ncbi:MAG: hypothetical protein N4A38_00230 [Candidatus Gracilibacteria bacterium]|nr:hypothetical protein [Candidatus Gracilibacteria bacterium]
MENIVLISQIMGIMFMVMGVSLLFNKTFFIKVIDNLENSYLGMFMSGIVVMLLGLLIILNITNIVNINEIIMVVIGWIMFIKGAGFIIFPWVMIHLAGRMSRLLDYSPIFGILYLLIGGYLLYSANFMNLF